MSPEAQSLLEAVRRAEDPSPADEERVRAAVRAAVATGAVVGVAAGSSKFFELLAGFGASAMKGGTLLLCIAVAASVAQPEPRRLAPPEQLRLRSKPSASTPKRADASERQVPAPVPAKDAVRESPALAAKSTPAASPSRAASHAPSLKNELALLVEAQAALRRGDGAAAVRLLDAHATADRQLAAERGAVRILGLCAAGRETEARRAASEFLRDHPGSVHRQAILASCIGEQSKRDR